MTSNINKRGRKKLDPIHDHCYIYICKLGEFRFITKKIPNTYLPPGFPQSITPRTARKWLHELGFSLKKVCILMDMKEKMWWSTVNFIFVKLKYCNLACSNGQTEEIIGNESTEKRLVLFYHNESSFHASDGQSWQWAEAEKLMFRPKSQGQGIMISNFIEEHGGYL